MYQNLLEAFTHLITACMFLTLYDKDTRLSAIFVATFPTQLFALPVFTYEVFIMNS